MGLLHLPVALGKCHFWSDPERWVKHDTFLRKCKAEKGNCFWEFLFCPTGQHISTEKKGFQVAHVGGSLPTIHTHSVFQGFLFCFWARPRAIWSLWHQTSQAWSYPMHSRKIPGCFDPMCSPDINYWYTMWKAHWQSSCLEATGLRNVLQVLPFSKSPSTFQKH